jgi:hypothetical protein
MTIGTPHSTTTGIRPSSRRDGRDQKTDLHAAEPQTHHHDRQQQHEDPRPTEQRVGNWRVFLVFGELVVELSDRHQPAHPDQVQRADEVGVGIEFQDPHPVDLSRHLPFEDAERERHEHQTDAADECPQKLGNQSRGVFFGHAAISCVSRVSGSSAASGVRRL